MRPPGTVSIVFVKAIALAVRRAGVDDARLLAELGLARELLDDPEAFVPGVVIEAGWARAAALSGDPVFGLHAGETAPLGVYDVLDYAMLSSPTLGEGVTRLIRYYRIMSDHAALELVREGETARFVQRANVARSEGWRHAWECFFAASVARVRLALGAAWTPIRVSFSHDAPGDTREHARVFGPGVGFGHAVSELVCESSLLDRPLQTADAALGRIVTKYADELVARIPQADDTLARARMAVAARLRGGEPALSDVACELGQSARTLQRKLGEAGTTFQSLVDDARREAAHRYLDDPKVALAEIAFLLGFAQPNAFHRAFRRWTGKSPTAWRRDALMSPRRATP
jgi:AraC-like DNA-binding protein